MRDSISRPITPRAETIHQVDNAARAESSELGLGASLHAFKMQKNR
jgi:hypothetical protein